jgi:hypothetical protein
MIRLSLLSCLLFTSCLTPDTQPVIDSVMEWKRIEDAELAKHRSLAMVAKFSNDPAEQLEMSSNYMLLLNKHSAVSDEFATSLVDWARKVGQYDPAYAEKTVDQMLDVYIKIKEAIGNE